MFTVLYRLGAATADPPIPFGGRGGAPVVGALTLMNEGAIPRYRVTLDGPSAVEALPYEDAVYLIQATGISPIAFRDMLTFNGSVAIRYFGYKYTANIAAELANRDAATFAEKFPGTFFVSDSLRQDLERSSDIQAFTQVNSVTFQDADDVMMESGDTFAIVIGEPLSFANPATLRSVPQSPDCGASCGTENVAPSSSSSEEPPEEWVPQETSLVWLPASDLPPKQCTADFPTINLAEPDPNAPQIPELFISTSGHRVVYFQWPATRIVDTRNGNVQEVRAGLQAVSRNAKFLLLFGTDYSLFNVDTGESEALSGLPAPSEMPQLSISDNGRFITYTDQDDLLLHRWDRQTNENTTIVSSLAPYPITAHSISADGMLVAYVLFGDVAAPGLHLYDARIQEDVLVHPAPVVTENQMPFKLNSAGTKLFFRTDNADYAYDIASKTTASADFNVFDRYLSDDGRTVLQHENGISTPRYMTPDVQMWENSTWVLRGDRNAVVASRIDTHAYSPAGRIGRHYGLELETEILSGNGRFVAFIRSIERHGLEDYALNVYDAATDKVAVLNPTTDCPTAQNECECPSEVSSPLGECVYEQVSCWADDPDLLGETTVCRLMCDGEERGGGYFTIPEAFNRSR